MFYGGQTHLVHDTKWEGVVGLLRFPKFPLSDHGVHANIVPTPPRELEFREPNEPSFKNHKKSILNMFPRRIFLEFFRDVDFIIIYRVNFRVMASNARKEVENCWSSRFTHLRLNFVIVYIHEPFFEGISLR